MASGCYHVRVVAQQAALRFSAIQAGLVEFNRDGRKRALANVVRMSTSTASEPKRPAFRGRKCGRKWRKRMGRRNHDIDQETLEVLGGLEDQEDLRNGYAAVRHRIEHY